PIYSYSSYASLRALLSLPTRRSSDLTTNLLKFMRASIKMIGVSNLQSFIASMTQKLTLSDISDESKNYLDKAGISESELLRHGRSEERFSRNAETDLVCRLLLEKEKD